MPTVTRMPMPKTQPKISKMTENNHAILLGYLITPPGPPSDGEPSDGPPCRCSFGPNHNYVLIRYDSQGR
jgi:hypothetical protein